MGEASFVVPNFYGGEISQYSQGRFDRPEYRTSLNVCFNSLTIEIGAWTRRPGTQFAGTTRGALPGWLVKYDFTQRRPYFMEFTDGYLRFRDGADLVSTNDTQVVLSISMTTPAVVQIGSALVNWQTGDYLIFRDLGTTAPLLQNRQFIATKIDATHFSIRDAINGVDIVGLDLQPVSLLATVARVQEVLTPYTGGVWTSLRAVQAETLNVLLCPGIAPQALQVTKLPATSVNAEFALSAASFLDGPYLDPFTSGIQANPSAQTGVITITLDYPAYVATTAYQAGAFATTGGVNYVSLVDQNVGNAPAGSPAQWATTQAPLAISPNGFQATDFGRLVRLFSEPNFWNATAAYLAGQVVAYNPGNIPGASTYWTCKTGNTGNIPGLDTTNWQIATNAAQWTWGKIVSLANQIPQATGAVIGNMTNTAAAFDGTTVQTKSASTNASAPASFTVSGFVGKNFTGGTKQIGSATIWPSTDGGFSLLTYNDGIGHVYTVSSAVTINLRASQTAPIAASDGIVLGSTGLISGTTAAQAIPSNDPNTAWNYVWFEISATADPGHILTPITYSIYVAEIEFFTPPTSATSSAGANVELLGPPLLYTAPIRTWRLGIYSQSTGWPTCGCYHEGRIWLGGAVANHFDACVSNGIVGNKINFAPTDQYGAVAANSAISYTLNSDGVNPIFWMQPDLQGVLIGTQAGEWLVQAPTSGPISANNIVSRRITKVGCANVEPARTEHTNLFVQRYKQRLLEIFAEVYSGKFTAPNIGDDAQHISRSGIQQIAYQQGAAAPVVWCRDGQNKLFGVTYKRDKLDSAQRATTAWHRHQLGSTRTVESICVGPSAAGDVDTLAMVTADPVMGIRHVELLSDMRDEASSLIQGWFLDNAVRPTSMVVNPADATNPFGSLTLNGLWHLNSSTVSVFAGGLDCGDFPVISGSCVVPFGDGLSYGAGGGLLTADYVATFGGNFPALVGFIYASQGQIVRPVAQPDTGARNGPGFGKKRRIHRYVMQAINALGISVGTDFTKMYPARFAQANLAAIAPLTMFSGIHEDTLNDDYSYDGMLCWQVSRPYPATVVAIGGNLQTQDQ